MFARPSAKQNKPRSSSINMNAKKHALTFVTITVFIDTVGFGVIMPVLPQFLAELSGSTLSEASVLAGYLVAC